MKSDISYQVAISTAKGFYNMGYITKDELVSFENYLRKKYNPMHPVLALNHYLLISPNDHLTLSPTRGNVTPEGE